MTVLLAVSVLIEIFSGLAVLDDGDVLYDHNTSDIPQFVCIATERGGGGSIVPYLLADMDRRVQIYGVHLDIGIFRSRWKVEVLKS